ncbi:hypothetical protein EKO27_g3240 [Xylaria grammica]|uniref:Uncharacterized protein n=1 Tax=Xylaria grammica TaxID=363999 RepID=A0A439DBX6_9PEZI|nr:hypothetical protein EKO27_g3240 [Xylaria grammica]
MRGFPITQNDEKSTANCFGRMPSRLADLLGHRNSSAGVQQLPSAPASPTNIVAGNGPNHTENQARPSTPYVPQHAAATFLKTATPREMRRENEIL